MLWNRKGSELEEKNLVGMTSLFGHDRYAANELILFVCRRNVKD